MRNEWPILNHDRDNETFAFLHLASQMLGKIRLRKSTWENHGWHLTLRPNASGLSILPTRTGNGRSFTLALDLCAHGIALSISDGTRELLPFDVPTVAALRDDLVATLDRYGLPSNFYDLPSEIPDAVKFRDDHRRRTYDRDSATRLLQAFNAVVPVFAKFRAGFRGKGSPVQFFWGSFDLAVTRFSGRGAPPHPGGMPGLPDRIMREAYSHEVSSAGFWPGGVTATDAAPLFYSYAYPEPDGFRTAEVDSGAFNSGLGEYVLPYDEVRTAADPEAKLLGFLQSTYDAAANLAQWDRSALERDPVAP